MPQLKQHVDQCQVCQEEYEMLRDRMKMDHEGQMPTLEALEQQIRAAKSG